MTRVCLVGNEDVNLQYELLSRETSRDALSSYDLERPFENTLAIRTVSVGAAISLLNDLQWYLVRFAEEALVLEPSISDEEWLSRDLAEAVGSGDLDPAETDEYLKLYGIVSDGSAVDSPVDDTDTPSDADDPEIDGMESDTEGAPNYDNSPDSALTGRLVEPLYVRRTDGSVPEYDLRDVEDVLVVRLTESEFTP